MLDCRWLQQPESSTTESLTVLLPLVKKDRNRHNKDKDNNNNHQGKAPQQKESEKESKKKETVNYTFPKKYLLQLPPPSFPNPSYFLPNSPFSFFSPPEIPILLFTEEG